MFQPSGSWFQSDIIRGKNDFCLCWVLQGRIIKDEECMFRDFLKSGLRSFVLVISTFLFAILYIMTSQASFCLLFYTSWQVKHLFVCYFIHHDKSSIFLFAILYIMTSQASFCPSWRLGHLKHCNMSPTLNVFRCLLVTNLTSLHWTISILSI
jgi:hypothetical protein